MWFCYSRANPLLNYLTHQDDTGPNTVCSRVDDVLKLTRLAYYAVKLLKTLQPPP